MNLTRSFLIATVAVGAMTLSACGKKKEDAKDLGAPAPAPTQTPQTQAPPAGPGGQPPAPQPQVLTPLDPGQNGSGTQPQVDQNPPKPRDNRRAGRGHQAPGQNQNQNGVQEPSRVETAPPQTGSQNDNGLVYTGAGQDNTLSTLLQRESQQSAQQQSQNKLLANAIEQVDLFQDAMTNQATLTVFMKEGSHNVAYNLVSSLAGNQIYKANLVQSALGIATTGTSAVDGTMQCLDAEDNLKSCSNVLISMSVKKGKSKSTVNILVRDSVADLHVDLNNSSGSPNYERFKEFILSSYLDRDTQSKARSIHMQTFEVVKGRSGFQVQVLGLDHEFLAFEGELLASASGSAVNVPVSKKVPRRRSYILGSDQWRLNLQNSLGQVRLIMNDGAGQLKLRASSVPSANYPLDIFTMTFTRRVTAVIELSPTTLK